MIYIVKDNQQMRMENKFNSNFVPIYHVWCAQCGHEKAYRKRLVRCPECKTDLHEKRWLM